VKGNAWETIPENKIPSILPRSVFATNFRLIIAHDCVQRHLNRTGIQVLRFAQCVSTRMKWNVTTSKNAGV